MPGLHGRRGHNKNKYYVTNRDESPTRSIMSGDSPNAHKNEMFDFSREGRSSPVPTTSKDLGGGVQNASTVSNAIAVVDPDKKDKEEERVEMCSPTLHDDPDDMGAKTGSSENVNCDDGNRDGGDDDKAKKLNGTDKLDGVWVPANKPRDQDQDEDDNCVVKCLYYTLQCCECSIM